MHTFKLILVLTITFSSLATTNVAFASQSALIAVMDLLLGQDDSVITSPKRRDFGASTVYSQNGENLMSRVVGNTVVSYTYDDFNRIQTLSSDNADDPTANIEITFTYVSLNSDRLSKVDLISFSEFGSELKGQITYDYDAQGRFTDQTVASFEGSVGSEPADEEIFAIDYTYEPNYTNGRLSSITRTFINNLAPPLGGTGSVTLMISYSQGTVVELREVTEQGGQAIGQRINSAPTTQRLRKQIITSDGRVVFDETETANYKNEACSDSNRLVEQNLLTLTLFFSFSLTFYAPEFCIDPI